MLPLPRVCGTLNDAQFAPPETRTESPACCAPDAGIPIGGHSAARYTHTLLDAMGRARAVGRLPADDTADVASPKRRAEIHSPLHSPGTQAPVVMRHCGRFGAVSKTVVGRKVHRGFESLPLRFVGRNPWREQGFLQA